MSEVNLYFPTPIYTESNLFDEEQNEQWTNKILELQQSIPSGGDEWQGNTYTTHNTYNLMLDDDFKPLITSITSHVSAFAKEFNSIYDHVCNSAWGNINLPGTFQEYHAHPGSVFSCVYYPSIPEGSGNIVFESPFVPDMSPVKSITQQNHLTFENINYAPRNGTLIIFRSFIKHCVKQGTNDKPRVSIALNFG